MKRLLWLWLVALAGCARDRAIVAPANERASQISTLVWSTTLGFLFIGLVMWGLILYAARRRRGSYDWHAEPELEDGKAWVWIGGVILPGITFAFFVVWSLIRMHTASPQAHHDMQLSPDIEVIGHRWWWEVKYRGETPDKTIVDANQIHIPVGQHVTVELLTRDVIHSLWIPNLEGKVDLIPGQTNRIVLNADTPGRYDGQCAEFCGEQHAHMRIAVIVDAPVDYANWKKRAQEPADTPRDAKRLKGLEVFEGKACGMCHTIRGTRARGTIGPDLTHVGSRLGIGALSFPNNHGYLAGWSTRAQSLKPGAEMPNLTDLTGEELDALVAYLAGLQ